MRAAGADGGGIFMLDEAWRPPNATSPAARRVIELLRQPLAEMPTLILQLVIALFTVDNYPQILYLSFGCAEVTTPT